MSRIVRLLDPPELTPRQLAQRRYQASAKGKAAVARQRAKQALRAEWRAAEVRRVVRWEQANRITRRVYKRTWAQTNRRLKVAA